MSTGYTQADLDRLRTAMLNGVKETQMGGRKVVFHSLKEQRDLYDAVASELAAASAPVQPRFPRAVQIVVDL
jgi:hypothetical protein